MNNFIEQLASEVLADEKELQAAHEFLDRLREFEESSAGVAYLEQKRVELQGEIADLETRKSVLENIDHWKLLAASEAAFLMYSIYVKPLSPDAQKKLQETFLRASGFVATGIDMWRDATGLKLVRQPAVSHVCGKAVEHIQSEVVRGLREREAVLLGRSPKPGPFKEGKV